MEYVKKTIVLKELEKGYSVSEKPISGILRLENECGVSRIFLTAINFCALDGEGYYLMIVDSLGQIVELQVGARPLSFFKALDEPISLNGGITCGIAYLKNNIFTTVAFARDGTGLSVSDFKKILEKKSAFLRKQAEKTKKSTPLEVETKKEEPEPVYDDEAVATENYFDLDKEINEKLTSIKEKENERLFTTHANVDTKKQEEEKEEDDCFKRFEDAFIESPIGAYTEQSPYYLEAERELKEILIKFPRETALERSFPDSEWAKINYSSDKYYVVGVIKEKGAPKYLCYGVPSDYSLAPPKELKDYCSFLPLSPLEGEPDGYWMMFQDAISGDCIKKKD